MRGRIKKRIYCLLYHVKVRFFKVAQHSHRSFHSIPLYSDYAYSIALWIVEGLAFVLGAPLRLRASPAAVVGVHELGIVDGLLDAALPMLAVFVVVLLLPVGFPRGLAPEASRVVDARGCLVEEWIVGPAADAAGRKEGRRGW